ncbi:hypothetical protein ASPFODRAFT_212785 [Aspergillus luchuensis CBS 106.47]|uniref:Uncharacterized protein n=1 Tax=Aspergillus luchuensis (strain CBS 106.47) TaxID=1137211 RepID=A0A1M3T0I1_ASPLC|nr:hypothetical protein ASPFODRAFT_212785 [Aspergillus luchuensis CBS 106.47]
MHRRTTTSTETRTEKSPVRRIYPDQPSSNTTATYEAHASASMEGHRWSVSDMGCASDVAIPRDSGAERESPTTIPADVTCGERNETTDDRSCTLPSQTAKSRLGTLHGSFWDWTWSQSEYLTGSETDRFLHPSIPAQQPGGWPFGGDAEEPQDCATESFKTPLCAAWRGSQLGAPDSVSNAIASLGSIGACFRSTAHDRLPPPHRSLHQEARAPAPVRNCESLLPPWLLQTMTDYQETEMRPFDNVGANSQKLSRNVTVPEGQAEQRHST